MDGTGDTFGTVEELHTRARELAERRPDRYVFRQVGTSRLGKPLMPLSVPDGPRNVIVVAGAHANEPVGGVTALEPAHRLSEPAGRADRAEAAGAGRHFPHGRRWHCSTICGPSSSVRCTAWTSAAAGCS